MSTPAIVIEARTWVGTPWVHQGRSRAGVDCAGLLVLCARITHGNSFDLANYAAQAADETMLALCAQHMIRLPLAQLEPGHVVVIKWGNQRHLAIVGDYAPAPGNLTLIHASSHYGSVVEHRLDSKWRRLCIAAFALPDSAEAA